MTEYPTEIVDKYRKILAMVEGTTGPEHLAWDRKRLAFIASYPGVHEQARPKTWRDLLTTDPEAIDWRSLTPEELLEAREIVVTRMRESAKGSAATMLARAVDTVTKWLMGGGMVRRRKRNAESDARDAVEDILDDARIDDDGDTIEIRIRISYDQLRALGEWEGSPECLGYELLSAIADDEGEE